MPRITDFSLFIQEESLMALKVTCIDSISVTETYPNGLNLLKEKKVFVMFIIF